MLSFKGFNLFIKDLSCLTRSETSLIFFHLTINTNKDS